MWQCMGDGFSILLPEADAVWVFGGNFNLSRIPAAPQEHRRICLILDLSAKPNEVTPSVKDTKDM